LGIVVVLALSVGLLAVAFAVHVVVWRLRVPARQGRALVAVFGVVGVAGFLFASFVGPFDLSARPLMLPVAVMTYVGCALVYLILFSAIEADSPTLTILGMIRRAGSMGVSEAVLAAALREHDVVRVRIDQMVADGLATRERDILKETGQARSLVAPVLLYRRLLRRPDLLSERPPGMPQ
jgi:hypothetical protein